jgi:hypothetical protein
LIAGSGTLLTAAFVGLVTYLTRQAIPALFGTASAADKLKEIASDRNFAKESINKKNNQSLMRFGPVLPEAGSVGGTAGYEGNMAIRASADNARQEYLRMNEGRQMRNGEMSQTGANYAAIKDTNASFKKTDAFQRLDAKESYLKATQTTGMAGSFRQGMSASKEYYGSLKENSKEYVSGMRKQMRATTKTGQVMKKMSMVGVRGYRAIGTAVKTSTFALELFGKGLMAAMPVIMMLIMAYQLLSGAVEWLMKATGLFTTSNDELHDSLASLGSELDKQAIKQNEYNLLLASSSFSLDELALAAERAGNRQMALSDAISAPLQELEAFNLTASTFDKWWDNDIYDKAADSLQNLAGQLKDTGEMQNFLTHAKDKGLKVTEASLLDPSSKDTTTTQRTFKALDSFFKSQAKRAKNYESNIKD